MTSSLPPRKKIYFSAKEKIDLNVGVHSLLSSVIRLREWQLLCRFPKIDRLALLPLPQR